MLSGVLYISVHAQPPAERRTLNCAGRGTTLRTCTYPATCDYVLLLAAAYWVLAMPPYHITLDHVRFATGTLPNTWVSDALDRGSKSSGCSTTPSVHRLLCSSCCSSLSRSACMCPELRSKFGVRMLHFGGVAQCELCSGSQRR